MTNIKENLDKRICDCLDNATNTQTYREFIIDGWKELNMPLNDQEIQSLDLVSNEELNHMVEELNWLLSK